MSSSSSLCRQHFPHPSQSDSHSSWSISAKDFSFPAELGRWVRDASLDLQDITGLTFNPLTRTYKLGADVDVNYMVHCQREAQA